MIIYIFFSLYFPVNHINVSFKFLIGIDDRPVPYHKFTFSEIELKSSVK